MIVGGGPNGCGKTTVALQYSTDTNIPYVGADAIAANLNPTSPTSVQIEAGRQFLQTIDQLISDGNSCVVESTLSGRTFRHAIQKASENGFVIKVVFVFVDSEEACIARVTERVRKGGHDVPTPDIRRRFRRSIRNFWTFYRELSDHWVRLYNGGSQIQYVAVGSGSNLTIRDVRLHASFLALIGETDD